MRLAIVMLTTALVLAFPLASMAEPTVIHVPGDFPTVQQGLDAGNFGDMVLVAPGVYHENLVMTVQHDGVRLISEGGPAVTTIDGSAVARVFTCSDLGPRTRIEGFAIQNGRAEPFTPDNIGGGLRLDHADLRIENNVIQDNFAEAAGGLYINESAPTLINNVIRNNEALGSGGGVYFDHFAHARVEFNLIVANTCGHFGGGLTIWVGSAPHILNNTVIFNEAQNGGGIFVNMNSHPEIFRNILAQNQAGGGIRIDDGQSTVTFGCNDVWQNLPANYSGMPDPTGTDGNISGDPAFCDPPGFDFTIASTSPCAPGNSPGGCNLIGARDVACGPVAIESTTWGQIKSSFHD